jgi:hypothetical protein
MDATDSTYSSELKQLSLFLWYPSWVRWLIAATIAGSVFFVILPIILLTIRIVEGRAEKELMAITFLVLGFGWSAVYLIRHFGGFSKPVMVTNDMLAHRCTKIDWRDVVSVWDSAFFSMLRIKDRKGQVLTFFVGLQGYEVLSAIAVEKKKANKTAHPTAGNVLL